VVRYSATVKTVAAVLLAAGIVTPIAGTLNIDPPQPGNRGSYWQLFRIVTSINPIENFISRKALGLPPTPVEEEDDFIYGGISTWDKLNRAQSKARLLQKYRRVFGIAELWIPANALGVEVRRTFRKSPGHYTVVGPAEVLLGFWRLSHSVGG
jgi:hypothetical protein